MTSYCNISRSSCRTIRPIATIQYLIGLVRITDAVRRPYLLVLCCWSIRKRPLLLTKLKSRSSLKPLLDLHLGERFDWPINIVYNRSCASKLNTNPASKVVYGSRVFFLLQNSAYTSLPVVLLRRTTSLFSSIILTMYIDQTSRHCRSSTQSLLSSRSSVRPNVTCKLYISLLLQLLYLYLLLRTMILTICITNTCTAIYPGII